jgi:hypothetical protein
MTLSAGGRWIRTSCSAPIDNGFKASSDTGPIDRRRDDVIRAVARLVNRDIGRQVGISFRPDDLCAQLESGREIGSNNVAVQRSGMRDLVARISWAEGLGRVA